MSIARRLGHRVEKGTLLERLPPELKEELYRRVYHSDYAIVHRSRAVTSLLSIRNAELGVHADLSIFRRNIDPVLLEIFIQDILRGTLSRYVQCLSLIYDPSTDIMEISGYRVDERGWTIGYSTFTIPLCIDLIQALFDLRNNLYVR